MRTVQTVEDKALMRISRKDLTVSQNCKSNKINNKYGNEDNKDNEIEAIERIISRDRVKRSP